MDPYQAKIIRHCELISQLGQRTAIIALVETADFWKSLLSERLTSGEVTLVGGSHISDPACTELASFLRAANQLRYGAILVATHGFSEYIAIKKQLNHLQKDGTIIINVIGYSALPARPYTAWAEQGLTYPGIFEVVGRYTESLNVNDKCYVEFGCFEGHTLSCAHHILGAYGIHRLIVFDSFGGLIGTNEDENTAFADGDYSASLQSVKHNLLAANCDLSRFTMVQGDIRQTADQMKSIPGNVVVAYIDVDIYEPSKAALNALTDKLVSGAILMFDDFDCMGATNEAGERRALREWLNENPAIKVEPFRSYGTFGRAFIVHKGKSAELSR